MSAANIREIVNEALKRGMQVNPEVIKFIEENPDYTSRVLYAITHKKKDSSPFLNLNDIVDNNTGLESKKAPILISRGRSFSDSVLPLPPEEISLMLADRLNKLKSIWATRPEKTNFVSLQFIARQFKGYRWTFALIAKKTDGRLLLDDGRAEISLKVSENRVLNEAVIGSAAAFKIKFDGEPIIEEMSDVELPETKDLKKKGGKVIVISGISEGNLDNEELFKKLQAEKAEGIIILGNLIDKRNLLDRGLLPTYGYEQLARHLEQLAKNQFKIVIPGENDETNMALPQKPIGFKLIKEAYNIANFRSLGNPSEIMLNEQRVLLYSGQGLKCYSGFDEEYAIKKMLKTRHLAPTLGVIPLATSSKDKMIIEDRPDVFLISHVKKPHDIMYRGVWSVAVPSFIESKCYGILDFDKTETDWVYV
ncbi:MAG: hypothetical protein ACP5TZ_03655 [Nitrososphaeria archaeon]